MTREEATTLCRYTKACCPQQAFDEYTPDAWFDILGKLTVEDCLHAVRAIVERQPFVAPAEIRAEVRRIRAARLEGFIYLPVDGDKDPQVYLAALRAQRAAVADGHREPAPPLPGARTHDVQALLAGASWRRP